MLTFFCELPAARLASTITDATLDTLQASRAAIALAMLDFSEARAALLAELQRRAIPFVAWLLLDAEDGYWLTADNVGRARARYAALHDWLCAHGLEPAGIGLDLEPPLSDSHALIREGGRALWRLVRRRRSRATFEHARRGYALLLDAIRRDGYHVESYQFPVVVDERRARSTLLQRALGFVDVEADRDVLMLYSTLLPPPWDDWLIDAYGADADAIAVGITGGGVSFVLEGARGRLLDLERLLDDLRRAARYTSTLYVFSLEGCIERGLLAPLCAAELTPCPDKPPSFPAGHLLRAALRALLRVEPIYDRLRGG